MFDDSEYSVLFPGRLLEVGVDLVGRRADPMMCRLGSIALVGSLAALCAGRLADQAPS